MTALIVGICLFIILAWIRRGHGGKFGQAIRNSDWHAWRSAIEDKERELAELKGVEPRR